MIQISKIEQGMSKAEVSCALGDTIDIHVQT